MLTAVVSGALVAGGAVYTAPALAAGPLSTTVLTVDESESPSADPTGASESPSAEPSESSQSPLPEPSETSSSPTPAPTTPSASPSSSPTPAPDKAKPTGGAFKLSVTSLWIGQKTVFTQKLTDFADTVSPDSQIVRKVYWGDGTSSTLGAASTTWNKVYTKNGTFKVYETLTDKAGNTLTTPAKTVKVVTPQGKLSLTKTKAYQGQLFGVKIGAIPAGTKGIYINWGDGTEDKLSSVKKQTVNGYILYKNGKYGNAKLTGKKDVKVSFANANGRSSLIKAGSINILKDGVKPAVTVKKPSSANRLKSWKTLTGTASDKASGAVWVSIDVQFVTTGGAYYCLNSSTKKFKRIYDDYDYEAYCGAVVVPVKSGKWSYKLPSGLKKGQIWASARSWDRADNASKWKSVSAKITKS
ncbi:PKD domain-containing protein [Actinoplanes rectilineatus]|uniref:PKD domain-containing protein n=1 Tax=Actinoplanes rectilineatus TaxID=113571 RepID=UPI000A6970AB|nr:PKD domain-containing protein [Actinoplanes rectilineatus]